MKSATDEGRRNTEKLTEYFKIITGRVTPRTLVKIYSKYTERLNL